jgi:hypothetical protein
MPSTTDAYVRAIVARAPDLTAEQRQQLAELLQPHVAADHRDTAA